MIDKRKCFFYAVLVNAFFIVYGSLIPFEIRHHTLAQALDAFRHIPYLKLGVASRADWIANIVLYIPFAFFACAWLESCAGMLRGRVAHSLVVFAAGSALAVVVEFAQIWFAPRTVSLNDIIAEIIGTGLGVILWITAGERFVDLVRKIVAGGSAALKAMAVSYLLGYIAQSLFPYDFTLSAVVLSSKLRSEHAHWFMAACSGGFICLAKLSAEVLAVVPLGALSCKVFEHDRRWTPLTAAYAGLGLGLLIEGSQFFLASGISQGLSVLTRGAGMVLGVFLYRGFTWQYFKSAVPYLRPLVIVAAFPYGLALLALNRWFTGHWLGWGGVGSRLATLHFLPFYYHYFTAEAVALVSLIYQFGMYFPIGVAVWLWRWAGRGELERRVFLPAVIAAGAAFVVEAGKLFISGEHPDPTNVLIATAAALSGYLLARYFFMIPTEAVRLRDPKAKI